MTSLHKLIYEYIQHTGDRPKLIIKDLETYNRLIDELGINNLPTRYFDYGDSKLKEIILLTIYGDITVLARDDYRIYPFYVPGGKS